MPNSAPTQIDNGIVWDGRGNKLFILSELLPAEQSASRRSVSWYQTCIFLGSVEEVPE
jgi:hypothetical protein